MVDSPQVSLKVIVAVHLVLTVWASMRGTPFLDTAYIYMNAFILAFGVWAIAVPESADAVLMFFLMNVLSIVMDIIFLATLAPTAKSAFEHLGVGVGLFRFSLGMSILNLLIKPFTSFILYRIHQSRGGQYGDLGIPGVPNFSGPSTASGRGYENIDQSVPSNVSNVETAAPHKAYKPPQ